MVPALIAGLLLGAAERAAEAAQGMDEVWFPSGSIRWGHTQTTPEIRRGICDTMSYLSTRTPLRLTEVPDLTRQGGLDPAAELGTLEIRYSEGIFNFGYGGQTKHYRKPNQGKKMVRLSVKHVTTRSTATTTLAHEMGHVLGFTHEFQRWDRGDNGVSVGAFAGRDPYNFGRPDKKNLRVLSPYDFNSRFATGYPAVTPPPQVPQGSLLSVHDINAIHRVYARALGTMADGLVFGEDVASGDFDGDGFEDLAVAARFSAPGARTGAVYFFKGVAQGPEEAGTGTTYVPWFRQLIPFGDGETRRIVLATGDTHTLHHSPPREEPRADGIDELIVGLPGAGRVEVWIVNAPERFRHRLVHCGGELLETNDSYAPWGGHGLAKVLTIRAGDVGAAASSDFGASLVTGRFFNGDGDDLAIGAPTGSGVTAVRPLAVRVADPEVDTRPGRGITPPAVFLLPDADAAKAVRLPDPTDEPTSEFGATLAVLEAFDHGHDTLVVGAPGAAVIGQAGSGKFFVYGRASVARPSGVGVAPTISGQYPAAVAGHKAGVIKGERYGASIVAFTTREGDGGVEHWLAVGAPEAPISNTRCGQVDLFAVAFRSNPEPRGGLTPPVCRAGMKFGQALAIASGRCTGALCPKDRAWIAVASPHEDKRRGAVYLWDVWAGGTLTRRIADTWRGANEGALFGERLIALRARENGGGFLVPAKRAEHPVLEPDAPVVLRQSGLAQVRFNTGGTSSWKSWTRTLSPGASADAPPANR